MFFLDFSPGRYLLFIMLLTIPGITAWTPFSDHRLRGSTVGTSSAPLHLQSARHSSQCHGQLLDNWTWTVDIRHKAPTTRAEPQPCYVVSEIRQRNDFICVLRRPWYEQRDGIMGFGQPFVTDHEESQSLMVAVRLVSSMSLKFEQ